MRLIAQGTGFWNTSTEQDRNLIQPDPCPCPIFRMKAGGNNGATDCNETALDCTGDQSDSSSGQRNPQFGVSAFCVG